MAQVLIHYAEIGLKGRNRHRFEQRLIANIKTVLGQSIQAQCFAKQILLEIPSTLINQSLKKLPQVFGIAWLAPVTETKSQIDAITQAAVKLAKTKINSKTSFAIRATRSDKRLAFTSRDLEIKLGEAVRLAIKAKVNLTQPDRTIYLSCHQDKTYLYTEKIPGPGGLPVVTSGKVLSLISGGFDSIASSYLLAKRGALVDFLHFHVFPDSQKVLSSKIKIIVDHLGSFTLSQKLFLSGYTPFQMKVLDLPANQSRQELVVFRRLMVRVGEKLAQKYGYQALVLGDSLGQVASQTMDNIVAVDRAVAIPVFRPLIGMDKKDIIDLVKTIGLYQAAIQPYKDCCSIIATHPATTVNWEKLAALEKQINLAKIVDAITNQTQVINL